MCFRYTTNTIKLPQSAPARTRFQARRNRDPRLDTGDGHDHPLSPSGQDSAGRVRRGDSTPGMPRPGLEPGTPRQDRGVIVLFTIRAARRKARDSNPHSPQGNRVSSAARPTVSGYLPVYRMDHRESNPDLLVASQASFHWTSSPLITTKVRPRIELGPPSYREGMRRTRGPEFTKNRPGGSRTPVSFL